MCQKHITYNYTKQEQQANIVTSAVSVPISVIAFLILCFKSDHYDKLIVSLLYGSGLIIVFIASTAYHWHCYLLNYTKKKNYKLNRILQILDRTTVLNCIASSCVPWLLLIKFPEYAYGTSVWIVYFIAALGFAFELTMAADYPLFAISFYVAVGLVPGIAVFTQLTIPVPGFLGIAAASIIYLLGTLFFTADGKIPYAHAIWHTFVLVASAVHFVNVYRCFQVKHKQYYCLHLMTAYL